MKYEYEVFASTTRDTQIFAGSLEEEEYDDDTKWRDWDGDILLDVVMAENEKEAVKAVAWRNDMHESALYAVRHTASATLPDQKTRIEASSFADEKQTGIVVSVPGRNSEIYVVADHEKLSAYSDPGENLYQVLSWNDEYHSMSIISSPVSIETARKIMYDRVVDRLVDLDIAKGKEDAERMCSAALALKLKGDDLMVFPYTAAIQYGGEFEERYEIVLCPSVPSVND